MDVAAPVAALVLGAGRGERLGHALPKAFVPLEGRTLIERSIRALAASGAIDLVQPVLAPGDRARWDALAIEIGFAGRLAPPVDGGAERQDSMRAGVEALPDSHAWVAVHDAARCLVSPDDVRAVVEAAREAGAAILAERVRDTIKRVVDGLIVETPDRGACWAAQTPQVIRRDWLLEALEANRGSGRTSTDDAQLVEWIGRPVRVVEARHPNPKITRAEDLVLARALLSEKTERAESKDEDTRA